MLDNEPTNNEENVGAAASEPTPARRTRRRSTSTDQVTADTSAQAGAAESGGSDATPPEEVKPAKAAKTTRARKTAKAAEPAPETGAAPAGDGSAAEAGPAADAAPTRRRRATKAQPPAADHATDAEQPAEQQAAAEPSEEQAAPTRRTRAKKTVATFSAAESAAAPAAEEPAPEPATRARRAPVAAIFVAPTAEELEQARAARAAAAAATEDDDEDEPPARTRRRRGRQADDEPAAEQDAEANDDADDDDDDDEESASARRRRRRGRRGRGRGKGPHDEDGSDDEQEAEASDEHDDDESESGDGMTRRRRRRRRRGSGGGDDAEHEDGVVTVVKIREPRSAKDEVQGVTGSTRLEAKRQRRRDGRDQRRTRPSILSESEFLARREAVDRLMVIRQKGDRTQIAVLEDGILVEHYVTRASSGSLVGNVYLGKVQNVLPSMEAAFIDIGRGRNAVLYAGEVNWDMAGLEGRARSIEHALKSGDSVLVQVTKDPIGHKGARLTSHIALSGRHLVYVPNGNASGISRKLSDVERKRLRDILKKLVPEGAGVIVRTAAEGASEDELERDVNRLSAQWDDIQAKVAAGGAPVQLYHEPDLVIRVVRDLFNEDFRELVVQGSDAYEMVESYIGHVSPDLVPRLKRHTGTSDVFATHRIDEQIMKGLDRKVFLPSGGSLVIDRTEAMTVIDVNTGKYTGTGGNLEETVTRNNLEAAEEIVRQLRLRDLGGIIVIDFIDMVLESNRELVLRRLTECLGRDRTKHQVTEITSLGLVQMTRKRIGQGLLEAFSETCEHCKGRGVMLHMEPVAEKKSSGGEASQPAEPAESSRRRGRRSRGGDKSEAATDSGHEDSAHGDSGHGDAGHGNSEDGDSGRKASSDGASGRGASGNRTSGHADAHEGSAGASSPSGAVEASAPVTSGETVNSGSAASTSGVATNSSGAPVSGVVRSGRRASAPVTSSEPVVSGSEEDEAPAAERPAARAASGTNGVASTNGPVTSTWTPPATSSWVNLGAATPTSASEPDPGSASGPADSDPGEAGTATQEPLLDLPGISSPEIDGLESESDSAHGRRRRVSRWRLRP